MLEYRRALAGFREAVAGGNPDPLEGATWIAAGEYPDLTLDQVTDPLDQLAWQFQRRIGSAGADAELLAGWLAADQRFVGNNAAYYDPDNSLINRVLARRTGIPISLSLVFIAVAARIGYTVEGVGFPGHFLTRTRLPSGEIVLLDAYNGGCRVDRATLAERLRVLSGQADLKESHLAAVTGRQLLLRMLGNLRAIYAHTRDLARLERTLDFLLALAPWDLDVRRDRGVVRHARGDATGALEDLGVYLEFRQDAPDARTIAEVVSQLRRGLALL